MDKCSGDGCPCREHARRPIPAVVVVLDPPPMVQTYGGPFGPFGPAEAAAYRRLAVRHRQRIT